ncbi:MAG TPA: TetR/AcrR family transcriptional regulator [Novosphingobium sp.]|nr:TetR/AcrR family transcriptional regulator [Novosphingobium sp.]HZV09086.1 TetR/AcrR family transcriptional regulator [Novosphingobium sp.]
MGKPLSRREERRGERRAAILETATQIFKDHGYAGTTMSGIAALLGGSKGTLWSYFCGKDELFAACIEEMTRAFREDLLKVLDPAAPLRPAVEGFCQRFIAKILAPDAIAFYRLLCGECGRAPEISRIFHERGPAVIEAMLIGFLTSHLAAGRLRGGTAMEMANFLFSMCMGMAHSRALLGIEPLPGPTPEAIAATFFRLYGGNGPEGALTEAGVGEGAV